MEAEIEKVLIGLGFEKNDFKRSMNEFSGLANACGTC